MVKEVVEPLAPYFPTLNNWKLDELSAQRYPQNSGKLTWHRDLARHPGLVVICNIVGSAVISARHNGSETAMSLRPGDTLALRAPGLFDKMLLSEDIRPEHAVSAVIGDTDRISVTARANSEPAKPIKDFYYYNWGPQPLK